MRMNKLFAGVLAGAMVVSCMVMPAGADVTYTSEVTGITGTLTYDANAYTWFAATDTYGTVWMQTWGGTVTVDGAYVTLTDGTTVDVTPDAANNNAIIIIDTDGGLAVVDNYTEVASVTYEVTYAEDEIADEEFWIGGGIGISSVSVSWWDSTEWGKASGGKPIALEDTAVMGVTLATEISEADLSANGYVVTLTNAAGDTAEVSGNTYYVEDGKYYIGIDVSDVPTDEALAITAVEFN